MNLRVGSNPDMPGVDMTDPGQVAQVRSFNRRVDAVVATASELVVIEATMWTADQKVSKLQGYMLLIPATPELTPYLGRRLVGELVTGQDDPIAALLCSRAGLRYVFYEPAWIQDFYAIYPERRRRTPHAGMLQALGESQSPPA